MRTPQTTTMNRWILLAVLVGLAASGYGAQERYCGEEGVWIQVLGSGGPELDDRSAASYLVWVDDKARVLVNMPPSTKYRLGQSGADFADLDVVLISNTQARHVSGLPGMLEGSITAERSRPLPILGPTGTADIPSTKTVIQRLIGKDGAFPHLARLTSALSPAGYKIVPREIKATGRAKWSNFPSESLSITAIPVHHGPYPSLAWRLGVAEQVIVFAGTFSNQRDVVAPLAKDADALVVAHAIPEMTRGRAKERYLVPSHIGRVAKNANARMLILGHRTSRTLGRESISRAALEEHFTGPLIFADEMECWGL